MGAVQKGRKQIVAGDKPTRKRSTHLTGGNPPAFLLGGKLNPEEGDPILNSYFDGASVNYIPSP